MASITWYNKKSPNPNIGDCFYDHDGVVKMFDGFNWCEVSAAQEIEPAFLPPSIEQLEKHPALKAAWEEFLVIKKLVGV